MNIKKYIACILVFCMAIGMASFPAAASDLADYTAVDAALSGVPDEAMLSACTPESAQAVREAVSAVVYGLASTSQTEVDAFASAIQSAIDGLEQKETIDVSQVKVYDRNGREEYADGTITISEEIYYKKALTDGVTSPEKNSTNFFCFSYYSGNNSDNKGTVVVDLGKLKNVTTLKVYGGGTSWGKDAPLA